MCYVCEMLGQDCGIDEGEFDTETDDYNIKVVDGKDIFICSRCQ